MTESEEIEGLRAELTALREKYNSVRDVTIDECIRRLGGRYGAAATHELRLMKQGTYDRLDIVPEDVGEAEDVLGEIEDMAADVPEAGEEFADSVLLKSRAIVDDARRSRHIRPGALTALHNMKAGLQKWVR